jgi:hypothetical protein
MPTIGQDRSTIKSTSLWTVKTGREPPLARKKRELPPFPTIHLLPGNKTPLFFRVLDPPTIDHSPVGIFGEVMFMIQ